MTDSQTIHLEGIGNVLFERSTRARRILITIRPGRGVRVAVPRRASFEEAVEFVNRKKPWIIKHLEKVSQYEKQRKAFDAAFLAIDRTEAKRQIIGRLCQLAQQYGFTFSKVSVRNQRTRWGSCSARGNISLNIKLIALSPELRDYVIFHELVHTRIHDHGRRFWKELDKYIENAKALAHKLVEYGLRLL